MLKRVDVTLRGDFDELAIDVLSPQIFVRNPLGMRYGTLREPAGYRRGQASNSGAGQCRKTRDQRCVHSRDHSQAKQFEKSTVSLTTPVSPGPAVAVGAFVCEPPSPGCPPAKRACGAASGRHGFAVAGTFSESVCGGDALGRQPKFTRPKKEPPASSPPCRSLSGSGRSRDRGELETIPRCSSVHADRTARTFGLPLRSVRMVRTIDQVHRGRRPALDGARNFAIQRVWHH